MGSKSEPDARLDPAWIPALRQWLELAWRWRFRLLLCGILGAPLGMAVRFAFPGRYVAVEQLLFDPQGMKLFSSTEPSGRFDANAQIDFVESQMGVLMSERVLTRLLVRECEASRPPQNVAKFCGEGQSSARALEALRGALSVKRAERSFLVDVIAVADTPDFAAHLASGLVESYIAEDAATRAAAAARLGAELDGRIAELRGNLADSEKRAQTYRRDEDLTTIGDKLLIELKLTDAANALDAAQTRLERAKARVKQLEATPQEATGLGALGDEDETRPLALLLERRAAARADLAPLAAHMGARNPALIEARSRLAAIERDIARELASIRAAARDQFGRAARERDGFAAAAQRLTAEINRARQSQIALQALDQSVAANRKLLENFESRSREIAEIGRIDLANLRIASEARPPPERRLLLGLAAYAVLGFALALMAALAAVALLAALAVAVYPEETAQGSAALHEAARRMRARIA